MSEKKGVSVEYYTSGCLLCGKPLEYFNHAKTLTCEICGLPFEANAACEDYHYICDSCHSKTAYEYITEIATNSNDKNPVSLAMDMMQNPFVNMHGPEHHYLIIAALLAAFKNAGGKIDLSDCLQKARQRAESVPGGICGMWGCCGAGVGAGIFVSIVTEATPLSTTEWGLANQMTSQSLCDISQNGGPRCCKRNTLLSIAKAVDFTSEYLKVNMERSERILCSFFPNNPTCKEGECLFYPVRGERT